MKYVFALMNIYVVIKGISMSNAKFNRKDQYAGFKRIFKHDIDWINKGWIRGEWKIYRLCKKLAGVC